MGNFYLYNNSDINLKIKIDDNIIIEVGKNDLYNCNLSNGMHNIKMYCEGWSSNELIGYIDQNIEISENTYFIYKSPMTIYGKGKLVNFGSPEKFKKYIKKTNRRYKILTIISFIILIIYLLF